MDLRKSENGAKLKIITAMIIYGTIGIFVRYIGMPSGLIAMMRGIIGTLFLLIFTKLRSIKLSFINIRRNLPLLLISGSLMGANWIMLFESYNYTSVAISTLCYYMAPVFIILASPIVVKEKLTLRKMICTFLALVGMVFISGVHKGADNKVSFVGIALGIGAAVLYATIILLNKKLKDITPYESTVTQLASSAVVLTPYVILTTDFSAVDTGALSIGLLIAVGIIHTGIAYVLYFGSIAKLKAQTAAMMSYIDPMLAIILSALVLHESMDAFSIMGAVLILGSTFVSEIHIKRKTA